MSTGANLESPPIAADTDARSGDRNEVHQVRRATALLAQAGIILSLAWAFQIESPALYRVVLPLAFAGALVHHWLPIAHRPMFFGWLSVAGVLMVLGAGPGAWLVGVGLGLIALCHVPLPFRWRLVLIGCIGSALLGMRSAWLPTPWPAVIWPVLGSMFMFRLALYLHDLKHRGPAPFGFALSYFFMLPNAVFLLFPVIDFQTFRRAYYDRPALEIYEEGMRWIFRGLTHLILYRFIYQYVVVSPEAVTTTVDIVRHLVGSYGLYLRVSGTFHLIVGLLHLFGFRLPETHRFFYLASSFSDLWRRINIYWKDFMQKMVYMPVIFSLKRRSETTALVAATMCVIAATWFLHSYQWFWLLGRWLFNPVDLTFWGFLGLVLVANTLWEQRRGRVRQLTAAAPSIRSLCREAVQTAAMFALMCVLWGYWSSPTIGEFLALFHQATVRSLDIAVVAGVLGTIALAAFVSRRLALGMPSGIATRRWWQHPFVSAAAPMMLIWAAGEPAVGTHLPTFAQTVGRQARTVGLNAYDSERLARGYYEEILGVDRFNGELWEVYARAGAAEDPDDLIFNDEMNDPDNPSIWILHEDALETTLRPLHETVFKGGRFTTNRWGMRDRHYDAARGTDTRRIAVLGQSYTMGAGVNDGETFEALIEERLNREWSPRTQLRYEALNFAVSGYSLAKQALILRNGRVGAFLPDVILIIGNPRDGAVVLEDVVRHVRKGLTLTEPLASWVREAGVTREMSRAEIRRRLSPRVGDLTSAAFADIASAAEQMGAVPVYALIPMPGDSRGEENVGALLSLAADAGLLVINLLDVYAGRDEATLILTASDRHPNAEGHRVIAGHLFDQLAGAPRGVLTSEPRAEVRGRTRQWAQWNRAQLGKSSASAAASATDDTPMDEWTISARGNATAELQSLRTKDWMRVTIGSNGDIGAVDVRIQHAGVPLSRGNRYALSFWMRADEGRHVRCGVSGSAAGGTLAEYEELQARRRWREFTCTFAATATDPGARIVFDLSGSDIPVEFTGIVLRELASNRTLLSAAPLAPER